MSWLSGGLSNLTDQISSFTKDVLTETTEEIEDPVAELQVARKKIEQLEEVNNHYKTEWEKLQKYSEEVHERAETAECQIAAISQEYRKLIQEKDSELCRLRTEAVNLREQQRRFVSGGESSQSPLKQLASESFFPKSRETGGRGKGEEGDEGTWEVAVLEPVAVVEGGGGWEGGGGGGGRREGEKGWEEYHDFGDVISSQGEINRLQLELSRVRTESQHWRSLAEEKGHSGDVTAGGGPMQAELASLREQVEDLQLCLQRERGQHQHDMSALEATHREKCHSLTRLSRTAVEGEDTLVGSQLQGGTGGGLGVADDTIRESLLSVLEEVSLDERGRDSGERRGDSNERGGDSDERGGERSEVSSLQSELDAAQKKCDKLEMKAEELYAEQIHRPSDWHESESALPAVLWPIEEMERLGAEKRNLEDCYISYTEGLKTQMQCLVAEKMALNEKLVTLTHEASGPLEKATTHQLQSEVELLKRQFVLEKETYTQHAEQERDKLTSVIEELQASMTEHEQCIVKLRTQCKESQSDAETLTVQISELAAEIQDKDRQLERLQGQALGENSDDVRKIMSENETEMERLEAEAERNDYGVKNTSSADNDSESAEVRDLREKLEAEGSRCERLQAHLAKLTAEHDGQLAQLVTEMERLQAHVASLTAEHDREMAQLVAERERLVAEVSRLEKNMVEGKEEGEESHIVSYGITTCVKSARIISSGEGGKEEQAVSVGGVMSHGSGATGAVESLETRGLLEDLRRSNSEKDAVIGQLNSSLSSIRRELEENIEKREAEVGVLRGKLVEMEERERGAIEALAHTELEVESVREELRVNDGHEMELRSLLQDRESRIAQLETETEKMKNEFSQVAAELSMTTNILKEKELVAEHSERNLREVGKLLSLREEEVAGLRRDLEERNRSHARETEPWEVAQHTTAEENRGALDLVIKERDDLLASVRDTQSEVDSMRAQLLEAREALESASCELQKATSWNAELELAIERATSEADVMRSEREGLTGRVRVLEETARASGEELAGKQAECNKLAKQLEHLKSHLVQIEEQYTQDALRAEEREREERQRAEQLKETLRNASYTGQQESLQTKAQVSALEEQLHALAGQRDAAVLQLSTAREEAESNAAALHNLQSVLEQFQRDQSSELSEALKRSQIELATALSDRETVQSHNITLQNQLKEAKAGVDVLCQQLVERDTKVEELKQKVTGLQSTLHSTEGAMEKLMREEGGRVDQNLVKNLVVGYVQAPDRKKPEVLNLIAKILDFSPSEVEQAQSRKGGWLSGLWGRPTPPSPISPKLPIQGNSLSQLFVSFLESESAPTVPSPSHPRLHLPPLGRVNLATDPDRPSRATVASLPLKPSLHSSTLPLLSSSHHSLPPLTHPSTTTADTRPILIHSHTDTPILTDSGTTHGVRTNIAPPQSTHSTSTPTPVEALSTLSLSTSGPPIPPTAHSSTSPTPSLLAASNSSDATRPQSEHQYPHHTPPVTNTRPSSTLRGTPPTAQLQHSRNHQSSILKNLLSTSN